MKYTVFLILISTVVISRAIAGTIKIDNVTLVATHRVYKDFREEHTVRLGERFYLSDTDYSAEAVEFIPDFAVNLKTGEVISRSDQLNNPAVRVIVYDKDKKVDETWAVRGKGAPHFFRRSLLSFELKDYKVSPTGTAQGAGEEKPDGNRGGGKETVIRNKGGSK